MVLAVPSMVPLCDTAASVYSGSALKICMTRKEEFTNYVIYKWMTLDSGDGEEREREG